MDAPQVLRMQIKIHAPLEAVYQALTTADALQTWLAESAEVDLASNRFAFWGKYTPGNPDADSDHIKLLEHKKNRQLKFRWNVAGQETTVDFKFRSRDANTTMLTLIHERGGMLHHREDTFTYEDYWFINLENLRRYLDGKPGDARVDFSQPMLGNIRHLLDSSATPEEIYAVLTQPELIEKWIASKANITLEKGTEYDIGWGVSGIKILDLEDNKKLSISWQEENGEETIVTWSLEASGGKTRITFTHSGFDDDHRNAGIWAGWMNFLNWIRSVAEYGADWQPPMIPLADHPYAQIYPKSMMDAQGDLVEFEV